MSISIIIPSYNQELYLEEAIESCLNQTVKPDEIIIIDDGSTDHSLDLAKKYLDKGVKVISQTNRGLSSARNTGIMNAIGDWIVPLDADDVLQENAIEIITESIKKTDADAIGLSFKEFGIRETLIVLMPNPTVEDFKIANRIGYCSAIKRDVLLEVGGYSSKMWCGFEDYHLWFNLLSRGKKIITIPNIVWLYRTKEKSMIHDAMNHSDELMDIIAKDFPQLGSWKNIKNPLPQ